MSNSIYSENSARQAGNLTHKPLAGLNDKLRPTVTYDKAIGIAIDMLRAAPKMTFTDAAIAISGKYIVKHPKLDGVSADTLRVAIGREYRRSYKRPRLGMTGHSVKKLKRKRPERSVKAVQAREPVVETAPRRQVDRTAELLEGVKAVLKLSIPDDNKLRAIKNIVV